MKSPFNTPDVPETPGLVSDLGKTAAITAASTVGMLVGFAIAGTVSRKLRARKERKNADNTNTSE